MPAGTACILHFACSANKAITSMAQAARHAAIWKAAFCVKMEANALTATVAIIYKTKHVFPAIVQC